ncbi:unnamed protein product, partial [Laminaria digitata]
DADKEKVEDNFIAPETDSELESAGEGKMSIKSSSTQDGGGGSSGGFAALGRFLFGSRTGSTHAMVVPGKDGPDGKETLEEPTGDESDVDEREPAAERVETLLKDISGEGNGGSLTAGSL